MSLATFDGATFDAARDGARLSSQLAQVQALMLDGRWRSLNAIVAAVGGNAAGISARLRDLRKPKFGHYDVQRRYLADGVWEYRMVPLATGQLVMQELFA